MLLIYDNANTREVFSGDEGLMAEIDSVVKEITESGELVDGEGLADPSHTKTVAPVDGVPAITDGPFAEAKEQVGGFYTVDVPTIEDAVEWARKIPMLPGDKIEVRKQR
jgi:hypothetical protein